MDEIFVDLDAANGAIDLVGHIWAPTVFLQGRASADMYSKVLSTARQVG